MLRWVVLSLQSQAFISFIALMIKLLWNLEHLKVFGSWKRTFFVHIQLSREHDDNKPGTLRIFTKTVVTVNGQEKLKMEEDNSFCFVRPKVMVSFIWVHLGIWKYAPYAVFRLKRATEVLELTYPGKYFACVNANWYPGKHRSRQ